MESIKNIKELRESLSKNYAAMLDKEISLGMGKEVANMAGKMIQSCKIELEYKNKMGYKEKIDFLETSEPTQQ